MQRPPIGPILVFLFLAVGGCAGPAKPLGRESAYPVGWDEEAPPRSELATVPYYVLEQSSSFLVKDAGYARYVLRVDRPQTSVSVFFSTTNRYAPEARGPDVMGDAYHFEFMQLRQLGKSTRVMDVNAAPAFSKGATGHTYTLAYIYGKGTNVQHVVPFEGDPASWRLEPGFYELVVATDEKLTVGINLKLGTPFWTTYYDPQELGQSRTEGLHSYLEVFPGSTPRSLDKAFFEVLNAERGENLNFFAFSNLLYRSTQAAVGAQGTVRVSVDSQEVSHRIEGTGIAAGQPQRSEAYAYGVHFNAPGPLRHEVRTRLEFGEAVSLQSDLVAQMLLFAVVLQPETTVTGIPSAANS